MKRYIIAATALFLISALTLSACNNNGGTGEEVSSTAAVQTTAELSSEPAQEEPEPSVSEEPELSVSEEQTADETQAPTSDSIVPDTVPQEQPGGVTSKGYAITEINGVTYINGVLIVNKSYSLPSDYAPGALTSECKAAFNEMQQMAEDEGLSIYIGSGYRSYSLQESIYNRYVNRDGKATADTYSARPGHSEHQTGLAIDLNDISSSFANTDEGKWIAENCWKYGFIIRYPKGKEDITGYMYEPWHIRYVGRQAAEQIYNSGLTLEEFYGIDSIYR